MRPMRVFERERERESSTIPQGRGFDAFPLNPYLIVSTINHAFTREFAYPFSSFSTLSPCIRITICPPSPTPKHFPRHLQSFLFFPDVQTKEKTIQSRSCSSNFLFSFETTFSQSQRFVTLEIRRVRMSRYHNDRLIERKIS